MTEADIVIAWNELPVYGARLIREAIGSSPERRICVLATQPTVPIKDVEQHLGQSIVYVERAGRSTWNDLKMQVPKVFFHTGWAYPQFNALAKEVRQNGGAVVSMVDNRWKGNPRQWLGALYFRIFLRRRFAAIWVPGASGNRLARFFGVESQRIVEGLYGADSALFAPGRSLDRRQSRIIFVGQYSSRKGVDLLASAWRICAQESWELHCFGQGPLLAELQELPQCRVFPFLPPEEIAKALRDARFLVLPSRDDHWGLVVHEAALSGTGLLVSEDVGAAVDIVSSRNGRVFRTGNLSALVETLEWAQRMEGEELAQLGKYSSDAGRRFGPRTWTESFRHCLRLAESPRRRVSQSEPRKESVNT